MTSIGRNLENLLAEIRRTEGTVNVVLESLKDVKEKTDLREFLLESVGNIPETQMLQETKKLMRGIVLGICENTISMEGAIEELEAISIDIAALLEAFEVGKQKYESTVRLNN